MNDNKKVSSSIVLKLNTWHLSQVFLGFIWINSLIILLFTGALVYQAETYIADTAKAMVGHTNVTNELPKGIKLPKILDERIPEHMQSAVRKIVIEQKIGSSWERLSSIKYRVSIPLNNVNSFLVIDYNIGENIVLFLKMFIVLLILELMFLIRSIGKGIRAMRHALKPISDLTQTARSINTIQTMQPDAQLRDLTGTIDTINVTDLDRRISISSAQTELKDLAGAINGMLDRINEAYRSQVRFVSDASHELRTPIAVIQGYANLLDRWGKNDEKALQESIEAIKSEAGSMKDLIEQLLFLARGDNDSMHLNMEEINLSELANEIIRETTMIDPNHEFSSNTNADVYIIGDAQLIKQAIRIFIDNSVKYTPYGGLIKVTTICDGSWAKILVQDNGIGIPPEDVPHVFDRFFRSDDSRARKTGGTGLGLSIAKWIIDRHKGSVEILSRKDLGTRITISLTCKEPVKLEGDSSTHLSS